MRKPEIQVVSGGGPSLLTLLGILFVTLKLTHVISWSWWLVSSPFWAVPAIAIGAALVVALFCLLMAAVFFVGERARGQ